MPSFKLAEVGSLNTAVNTSEVSWWDLRRSDSDDLRHSLHIAVWVRWFVGIAWFAQLNYRADFLHHAYIPNTLLAASLLALNGYVHYRIRSNRMITWHWALALSALDVVTITSGLIISGGFRNEFYVLYYPALAAFAVVFASFRLSFAWVTVTAVLYAALSLTLYEGVDFEDSQEKVLFIRIVTMYAVVAAVNLIFRLERIRRREAIERERELQRERIELSQTIHNTIAQSAYMIGIGVETAIELADDQLKAGHVKPSNAPRRGQRRRRAYRKAAGYPCAVEVDHVGAEASHRRRTHIRGPGAESCAAVPRLNVHHHHVNPRAGGSDRKRAASLNGYTGTALLHSTQRDDQRLPALARRQGYYRAGLRR